MYQPLQIPPGLPGMYVTGIPPPPEVAVCGGVGCLQVGVDASIHLSSPCSGGMLCLYVCANLSPRGLAAYK